MADDRAAGSRRLDRAAFERVLARAAELQGSGTDDSSGTLTEDQIVELGREAGLSPEHLRLAIAEERTRGVPVPESGFASTVIGVGRVQASRIVEGSPAELLGVIDLWMQREETLRVKRRIGDRAVWEPRTDLVGNVRRAFNLGGRGYALARATEIAATVTVADRGRSVVALDAVLDGHRGRVAGQAVAGSLAGASATAVMAVISVALPIALVPVILAPPAALALARRAQARAAAQAHLALEQLLDHLERGEHRRAGGLLGAIATTAALLEGRRPPR